MLFAQFRTLLQTFVAFLIFFTSDITAAS